MNQVAVEALRAKAARQRANCFQVLAADQHKARRIDQRINLANGHPLLAAQKPADGRAVPCRRVLGGAARLAQVLAQHALDRAAGVRVT